MNLVKELRALAEECADAVVNAGSDAIGNEDWADLLDATRRLDNAADILEGG